MKCGGVVLAVGFLVFVLAACGDREGTGTGSVETVPPMHSTQKSEKGSNVTTGLPAGCGPQQAADLVAAFAMAVAEHRRERAIEFLSKGNSFVVVTIYHGKEPGAGRVDSRTPAAAYDNFINTFGAVENPVLLGSVVGRVAPLAGVRGGAEGDNPTAGVEFAIRLGARSMTGKIGIDCATGAIYLGAMNVRPGLRPSKMCGSWLSMEAVRPRICAYPAA